MSVLFHLPIEFRLRQLELCRELGLKVICGLPSLVHQSPGDVIRMMAYKDVLLDDYLMNENTSQLTTKRSLELLKRFDANPVASHPQSFFSQSREKTTIFENPAELDYRVMHDWFVNLFQRAARTAHAKGIELLGASEATVQIRLALEAGVDVPIIEIVPLEPLVGLAAVRGAAKAYGKTTWGVHCAMGYYRAPEDLWMPERARITYDLFFSGGAGYFNEINMPLQHTGSCSGFFTIRGSPPLRLGEKERREFDDPICVRSREIMAEFYRFTQFHQRPGNGPRVGMGFVLGHLDGWTSMPQESMWMVDHPAFFPREALRTWHHFERTFDSEPWFIPPRKYYWAADASKRLSHGTPPCGQVDLVPFEASRERLSEYRCLAFLGWNTMTPEHYARLASFVKEGGVLFLGVPHCSTRTRADQQEAFIHAGDLRELCGVRILGPGVQIEEVYFAEQSGLASCIFPQGALYLEETRLAQVELHGAKVLAHPRGKPDQPALLEHRIGKGCVYLLATWDYPGDQLDAFITDILRTLAETGQCEISLEGRDVYYSIYDGRMPSGQPFSMVYLVNHNIYGQPSSPWLHANGMRIPMRVPGRQMRIAWVFDKIMIAPHDRFVQVTDVRREGSCWIVTLESVPSTCNGPPDEERVIQIEPGSGLITKITLDGTELVREKQADGDMAIRCRLSKANMMRIEIGSAAA